LYGKRRLRVVGRGAGRCVLRGHRGGAYGKGGWFVRNVMGGCGDHFREFLEPVSGSSTIMVDGRSQDADTGELLFSKSTPLAVDEKPTATIEPVALVDAKTGKAVGLDRAQAYRVSTPAGARLVIVNYTHPAVRTAAAQAVTATERVTLVETK